MRQTPTLKDGNTRESSNGSKRNGQRARKKTGEYVAVKT